MDIVKSQMRFDRYVVETLHFAINNEFNPSENESEFKLVPTFTRRIRKVQEHIYDLSLSVTFANDNEVVLPMDIEVAIRGRFVMSGIENEKDQVKLSGVAILFPYLRATLSMMMSLSNLPPINLPTINVAEMFNNECKKELSGTKSNKAVKPIKAKKAIQGS